MGSLGGVEDGREGHMKGIVVDYITTGAAQGCDAHQRGERALGQLDLWLSEESLSMYAAWARGGTASPFDRWTSAEG